LLYKKIQKILKIPRKNSYFKGKGRWVVRRWVGKEGRNFLLWLGRALLIKEIIIRTSKRAKRINHLQNSCTGGALVNRFISYPNASRVIDGSFITYSNSMKESLLGVNRETN